MAEEVTAPPAPAAADAPAPTAAAHIAEPAQDATPQAAPRPDAPAPTAAAHIAEPHPDAPAQPGADPKPGVDPKSGADPKPGVDLAAISDEDYAKLVQPDVEGQEVDRSLITPMAAALREAGVQPDVMAKVAPIYRKVVEDALAKDKADRDAKAKALADDAEKAFTADDWRDFRECYNEHISKDPDLAWLVCNTELGSNKTFIRICNLVGASLRVERTPPASAAAASSQTDLDRAVFEQTVPKHLR